MRIERLVLERYGAFSDRELSFASDVNLHVVYGPNEAGKTSALSAIGDLLFGFPARTDYDFRHEGKTLRIGGDLRHSNGELIGVRRRKGNKNTLLDPDDQPLPDDILSSILGGISRDAFFREFGLTAAALRSGGNELLSAGGRLAETLAAGSAGMSGLSKLQEELRRGADELFTPRRSGTKPFYVASDRRDLADREFRDATVTPEALRQVQVAEEAALAQLSELSEAHARSGGLLARWQRALRVRTQLARLDFISAELVGFAPLPDTAQETIAAWRAVIDNKADLERQIGVLDAESKAAATEFEALSLDEALLREGATVESLRERLGAIRKAVDDLPRRKAARDAAEAVLGEAARKLGLPSHAELLSGMPSDPSLADARVAINEMTRVIQQLEHANARCVRLEQELRAVEANDAKNVVVQDIEHVKQRFNALGDLHALQNQIRHDHAAISLERREIADAVASLNPSPKSAADLQTLQLPDPATVAKFANATELAEVEIERLRNSVLGHAQSIADIEAELVRLASTGVVPTRSDLAEAREIRNDRLEQMRTELDSERAVRQSLVEEVSLSSTRIDRITDELLNDTQRATRKEDTQDRLAERRRQRDAEADKLAALDEGLEKVIQDWKRTWLASGLEPLTPIAMQRWRERSEELVARVKKCDSRQADVEVMEASLSAAKGGVIAFLESTGRRCDRELPADILYAEAKGRFDELLDAWGDARAHEVAKNRLQNDIAEVRGEQKRIAEALDKLKATWPRVMAGIGLSADVTPAYAEAAIAVWNSIGGPKVSFEREVRSVETIAKDLADFDHDVSELAGRIAPDVSSLGAEAVVGEMAQRLADARVVNETSQRLRANAVRRASTRTNLLAGIEACREALKRAYEETHVDNVSDLARQIERLDARRALESERADVRRVLIDVGDGNDEDALRAEQDGLDLDQLSGEIERERLNEKKLLDDIRAATVVHSQKRQEVEGLTKGRDAIGAAARRTEASAEVLAIAEQWLLKSAASILARRAIEIHRSKVQDPMIARASELFFLATQHAFLGLAVSYDDDDQPVLVAQRNTDERVHISGLSEGTRDQLFLALRLALLERRTSEQMPFIGDDLLTSFDDNRTEAGLKLLVAAGLTRQIILFTHHAFVANLAASIRGQSVQVIHL